MSASGRQKTGLTAYNIIPAGRVLLNTGHKNIAPLHPKTCGFVKSMQASQPEEDVTWQQSDTVGDAGSQDSEGSLHRTTTAGAGSEGSAEQHLSHHVHREADDGDGNRAVDGSTAYIMYLEGSLITTRDRN